jgi:hypothetical protein
MVDVTALMPMYRGTFEGWFNPLRRWQILAMFCFNTGFADGSLDLQEFKEIKNPLIPKKVELEARAFELIMHR